ncbi:hypothetical protein DVH24_042379 [Malus domestica]|uniref:Uncharacterized protein n=1 Tax=Malus domestica TaxID=3750 RepID=A0A498IYA7_MALDO|nr:hypothetical protein DVH24_042379 [Malus domestica]
MSRTYYVKDDCLTLADAEDDIIVCFQQPSSIKEDGPRDESRVGPEGEDEEMMTALAAVRVIKRKKDVMAKVQGVARWSPTTDSGVEEFTSADINVFCNS